MYSISEIKKIADRMKNSKHWYEDDCRDLCDAADMLEEYEYARGFDRDRVIFEAADKLGVDIGERPPKRMSWTDGWHEYGGLDYCIENGCLVSGVIDGRPVYPYVRCVTGGYDNASGIKANKRNFERVIWF